MNSIASLTYPADYLVSGIGNVWSQMVKDPEFVRAYLQGLGLLGTQEALDVAAVASTTTPEDVPVTRRRYLVPIVLEDSQRGQGQALVFRLRRDRPVWLGSQPPESLFQVGSVYTLGAQLDAGLAAYPIGSLAFDTLANTPENPERVLVRGQDFDLEEHTILFRAGLEPAQDPDFYREDGRVVLWAQEAHAAVPWVRQHVGYAVGAPNIPPELKEFVLHTWRAYNFGLTPARLGAGLGELLGTAVSEGDETVEELTPDGIITDRRVYQTKGALVSPGDVLAAGQSLDGAFRVFEREQDLTELAAAVPAITVPTSMLRAYAAPVSFGWEPQMWENNRFHVIGTPEAVAAFWANTRLGPQSGSVVPAEFVYQHALRHGLVILVVDASKVAPAKLRNLQYLNLLLRTRSQVTGFMVIVKFNTDSKLDAGYSDSETDVCADVCVDEAGTGVPARHLQYTDSVHWKFIPACKEIT